MVAFVEPTILDDAEKLYDNVSDDIKQFGYDVLATRFKEVVDAQAKDGKSRTFDQIFPEPPGMKEFREEMERKAKERGNLPGVEQK